MKNGIYQIRNLRTNAVYIGSAAGRGFRNRWNLHRNQLEKSKHHSPILQRAWDKYGADNFIFEILLVCAPERCLMYEQIYLDYYQPRYNICLIAGNTTGRKHSQQTKDRLSNLRSGKSYNELYGVDKSKILRRQHSDRMSGSNNPFYGKKHSSETKKAISAKQTGSTMPDSTKLSWSQTRRGSDNPNSKLTVDDVVEIRKLFKQGVDGVTIAHKFKISTTNAYRIRDRRSWRHVQCH